MKLTSKFVLPLLIGLFMFSESMMAQANRSTRMQPQQKGKTAMQMPQHRMQMNRNMMGISDLTDAQREQIQTIRTAESKELMGIDNRLREERAKLNTLTTAEKYDANAVNKTVDEISKLEKSKLAAQLKYRQQIRELLTEEQRLAFDKRISGQHSFAGNRFNYFRNRN